MTRYTVPTPTKGPAPSHSPPDVRYAPGLKLARSLGWFSIGLGLVEVLSPNTVANWTGVQSKALVQAYGLREIITGVGILSSPRPAGWMWGRVAGDALDIVTLLGTAKRNGNGTGRPLAATAAVAGVTALDAMCGVQLSSAAALEG